MKTIKQSTLPKIVVDNTPKTVCILKQLTGSTIFIERENIPLLIEAIAPGYGKRSEENYLITLGNIKVSVKLSEKGIEIISATNAGGFPINPDSCNVRIMNQSIPELNQTKGQGMTKRQEEKLKAITSVINSYINLAGDLVIDTTYGSTRFKRLFIGKMGGFSSPSIIYKHYDFEEKKPYHKLFTEN